MNPSNQNANNANEEVFNRIQLKNNKKYVGLFTNTLEIHFVLSIS